MKKRIFTLILSVLLVFGLVACGDKQEEKPAGNTESEPAVSAQPEENVETEKTTEPEDGESSEKTENSEARDGKTLVVYFSMPETTKPDNMNAEEEYSTVVIDGEVLGNTQYVAYVIQENTGADIFRIEPVTPYPMNHAELEEVATEEKRNDAMPEIAAEVENIEQYDTIFLGYPNWYADMPRIIYSFLDQYDLSGKTIVPFVTSGGSGFSNTISTIADLEPDANVITDGLSISRNVVQDAEADIIEWVEGLGLSK